MRKFPALSVECQSRRNDCVTEFFSTVLRAEAEFDPIVGWIEHCLVKLGPAWTIPCDKNFHWKSLKLTIVTLGRWRCRRITEFHQDSAGTKLLSCGAVFMCVMVTTRTSWGCGTEWNFKIWLQTKSGTRKLKELLTEPTMLGMIIFSRKRIGAIMKADGWVAWCG